MLELWEKTNEHWSDSRIQISDGTTWEKSHRALIKTPAVRLSDALSENLISDL